MAEPEKKESFELNLESFDIENLFNAAEFEEKSPIEKLNEEIKTDDKKEETKEETEEIEEKEEKEEESKEDSETEEETEEEITDEDVMPFYEGFNKVAGIEFPEDFKPKPGIEGVYDYLLTLVDETKAEFVDEVKGMGDGLVGQLVDFLSNGGDVNKFKEVYFKKDNISELEVEGEDNESNQDLILTELWKREGYEEEEIKTKLEKFTAAGIKEDEAKMGKRKLNKIEAADKAKLVEEQVKAENERKAKLEAEVESIKQSILTAEDIGGLPISKENKQKLIEYGFKPGKDGLTDYQRKAMKDSTMKLKMLYLSMLDFKLSDLEKSAKTNVAKSVKKSLSRFTDTTSKAIQNNVANEEEQPGKTDFTKFKLNIH